MTDYTRGQRVVTPDGPGTVAYVRMASPYFSTVAAVSVALDTKRGLPGYTGSVYPSRDILPSTGSVLTDEELFAAIERHSQGW